MSPTTLLESLTQKRNSPQTAIELEDGTKVTYRALCGRLDSAVGLVQQLGLKEGDVLAIQADRGVALIATILGALQCGVTVLPLNTQYTSSEVRFYL